MKTMGKKEQDRAIQWQPYAAKLARQYCSQYGGDIEEWKSEALEALCIAAAKFDELRPSVVCGMGNFISALWHRIRAHLNEYRRKQGRMGITRAPRHMRIEQEELADVLVPYEHVECDLGDLMDTYLDDREKSVIYERYMESKQLRTVGDRLGVCKERVRQIESGALSKMRKALERQGVCYAGSN